MQLLLSIHQPLIRLSEQVFTGLKYIDKDVTYRRYENDWPVLIRSVSRVDYWNRVLPFFQRHVAAAAKSS